MAEPARFILSSLGFSRPNAEFRGLSFAPGLNVIWGASNAGKSFTIKALDYMFGAGTKLPDVRERQGYDTCWLELVLPRSGQTTLARALSGGDFKLFHGSIEAAQASEPARVLAASHSAKSESLSSFLLGELGITNKRIAKNLNGQTNTFTFRYFAPYLFTEETPMMAEWSPIRIGPQSGETLDKNVLKFILTGIDDSAVVATKSAGEQRAANAGKIEIIQELITTAVADLHEMFPDSNIEELELQAQEERLSRTIETHQTMLIERQSTLDLLQVERRHALDALDELKTRETELALTLDRFALLATVYDSDVQRLEALGEAADALMAGVRRACPLCGAEPAHQHELHGLEYVERTQQAVRAEIAKIRLERGDLGKTVASLRAEQEGLTGRIRRVTYDIQNLEGGIDRLRPIEASSRATYEELDSARQRLREALAIKKRIENLSTRQNALVEFKATPRRRDSISVGIGGVVGHEFASTVQGILRAWHFPGNPVVSFDDRTHDVLIDGKDRRSNGKGVRALMNAAFKIAVLVYCRSKNLPHSGIVALDSPLLSYRDPHTSRYGGLSPDEQAVTQTGLDEHFYRYLLDQARTAQFIVIENDAPPFDLGPRAMVTTFVGALGQGGRQGLL